MNNGPGAKSVDHQGSEDENAVTEPVGKPRLSSGIQPLQLAALLAVSGRGDAFDGAAGRSFSGCFDIFFSESVGGERGDDDVQPWNRSEVEIPEACRA